MGGRIREAEPVAAGDTMVLGSRTCSRRRRISPGHRRRISGCPSTSTSPSSPSAPAAAPGKDLGFPAATVSSVIDIGGRLGQAGAELEASISGAVRHLPVPFRNGQIRRRKQPPPPPQASLPPATEQIDLDVKRRHPDMDFFCGDSSFAKSNQVGLDVDALYVSCIQVNQAKQWRIYRAYGRINNYMSSVPHRGDLVGANK